MNAFVGYGIEGSDHYPALSQFVMTNFTNHATGFYFSFDEGSGTRANDSIGGLVGKFGTTAPAWSADSPTGQPGDFSLYFDGTKRVSAADSNQIIGTNGVDGDYTLQAWIKLPLNYAPAQRAVLFQYERKPGFYISINTNRTLHTTAFKIKDIPSTATIPNDGQWHHVAVVHNDGANMRFYIDGTLAHTVLYTNGVGFRVDNAITIGAEADGKNPFTGYLDRVRFDQRALPPAQFDFPATPRLAVRKNGNGLTLFWPATRAGYVLESNSNLSSNGWTTVPTQLSGEEFQATILPTGTAQFFRLKQ
jgi:hypothetical protein